MSDASATFAHPEAGDLPPGAAPTFGEGEHHGPGIESPLVLSAVEERLGLRRSAYPVGQFALDDIPATGQLKIFQSTVPGFVHIDADIAYERGGMVHYEAEVRETWLDRTSEGGSGSPADVVRALADLARLPHQSTVKVHFDA